MNLPGRLQRELIAAGDLTPERVTSKPQLRRCPTCTAWCLVAIPFLRHGATWVDAAPTTTYGELLALTSGHDTWEVSNREMEHRSAEYIKVADADKARDVHVTHSCGAAWPNHPAPLTNSRTKHASQLTESSELPPY